MAKRIEAVGVTAYYGQFKAIEDRPRPIGIAQTTKSRVRSSSGASVPALGGRAGRLAALAACQARPLGPQPMRHGRSQA